RKKQSRFFLFVYEGLYPLIKMECNSVKDEACKIFSANVCKLWRNYKVPLKQLSIRSSFGFFIFCKTLTTIKLKFFPHPFSLSLLYYPRQIAEKRMSPQS